MLMLLRNDDDDDDDDDDGVCGLKGNYFENEGRWNSL